MDSSHSFGGNGPSEPKKSNKRTFSAIKGLENPNELLLLGYEEPKEGSSLFDNRKKVYSGPRERMPKKDAEDAFKAHQILKGQDWFGFKKSQKKIKESQKYPNMGEVVLHFAGMIYEKVTGVGKKVPFNPRKGHNFSGPWNKIRPGYKAVDYDDYGALFHDMDYAYMEAKGGNPLLHWNYSDKKLVAYLEHIKKIREALTDKAQKGPLSRDGKVASTYMNLADINDTLYSMYAKKSMNEGSLQPHFLEMGLPSIVNTVTIGQVIQMGKNEELLDKQVPADLYEREPEAIEVYKVLRKRTKTGLDEKTLLDIYTRYEEGWNHKPEAETSHHALQMFRSRLVVDSPVKPILINEKIIMSDETGQNDLANLIMAKFLLLSGWGKKADNDWKKKMHFQLLNIIKRTTFQTNKKGLRIHESYYNDDMYKKDLGIALQTRLANPGVKEDVETLYKLFQKNFIASQNVLSASDRYYQLESTIDPQKVRKTLDPNVREDLLSYLDGIETTRKAELDELLGSKEPPKLNTSPRRLGRGERVYDDLPMDDDPNPAPRVTSTAVDIWHGIKQQDVDDFFRDVEAERKILELPAPVGWVPPIAKRRRKTKFRSMFTTRPMGFEHIPLGYPKGYGIRSHKGFPSLIRRRNF